MSSILISLLLLPFAILYIFIQSRKSKRKLIGFFHPYCDNGGGGERVLWMIVYALLSKRNDGNLAALHEIHNFDIVIYNGDKGRSKDQIITNVQQKFSIKFTDEQKQRVHIVYIASRFLLEAKYYPVATMIGQSLGGMLVGLECILTQPVNIFCDTIGAAFTFPIVKLLSGYQIKVIAYVHYPIISSDMLQKVREQRPSYNNNQHITSNVTVSSLKLIYYQAFAIAYAWVGSYADMVMVNSTWTQKHIESLWYASNSKRVEKTLKLIFPPCNTKPLQAMPLHTTSHRLQDETVLTRFPTALQDRIRNKRLIISVGQFRPEKDHHLQIKIMNELKLANTDGRYNDVMLVMIGSTRHTEDEALVTHLQHEIERLQLQDYITFCINQPYRVLELFFEYSLIGLHTMWNEHFGISIVEMMAAGVVTIAHNSGGPKSDIIQLQKTGYLATTAKEYAEYICHILDHYEEQEVLRNTARISCQRFSDEVFTQQIQTAYEQVL